MARASTRLGSIVTFRVPDELFRKLSEEAEKNQESMSDLIRRALREMFQFPIGYKCQHMIVLIQEGEEIVKPSLECGCDLTPIYELSEVMIGRLKFR